MVQHAPPVAAAPATRKKMYPAELQAMARIDRLLQPFDIAARSRILSWNQSNLAEEMSKALGPVDEAAVVA